MATQIVILRPMTPAESAESAASAVRLRLNLGHSYLDRRKVGHARAALADALGKMDKIDADEFPQLWALMARGCMALASRIEDF